MVPRVRKYDCEIKKKYIVLHRVVHTLRGTHHASTHGDYSALYAKLRDFEMQRLTLAVTFSRPLTGH